MTTHLILENGTVFTGQGFGVSADVIGEVVFTTSMTGYLETLTDPNNFGQIVVQTFPLIGNYGVIPSDFEFESVTPKAYIVRHLCQVPSNFRSEGKLDTFFVEKNIVGLSGIDTRQLTKIIRRNGVMKGVITTKDPSTINLENVKAYEVKDAIASVSRKATVIEGEGSKKIAVLDFGTKRSLLNHLNALDCQIHIFPHDATAGEILAINPNGIVLTDGPGNPNAPENAGIINTIKELNASGVPIFGVSLGHQLLALANGYEVEKMKFGNRGGNQAVKEIETGKVLITSQNHGYAVVGKEDTWSFVNINDGSCEGIDYGSSFSVQFSPRAYHKALDTTFLFEKFVARMEGRKN
ncbi:MAG: carbamoyl phosphate synthase small subunit [Defluviitaleaceae bacterium]|nr:carbamoyl phosphate synthase small subunit [Defluviitaleaceae bacterium]